MIMKFLLWAAGVIIVALLIFTGYGVVTGSLSWKDYLPFWSGVVGLVVGYILKQPTT